MKFLILAALLAIICCVACKKNNAETDFTCINYRIDSFQALPKASRPIVEIDQYTYHSATVFLLTAACCDGFNLLFDDHCNYLGAPSGGFTGGGDLRTLRDFSSAATFIKTLWVSN